MKKSTTSIVFSGDIGFDKYMDKKWEDEKLLSDEIYRFLHDADHVVANVEGALYRREEDLGTSNYIHTMEPEAACALERMKADIWNICNNHIMDAGEKGLLSTMDTARKFGCKTVGAGLNEEEASQPIIMENEAGGIGIISVGYYNGCVPATADTAGCFRWDRMDLIAKRIEEVKSKCRWCVVVSHGGEEFAAMPLPYTRQRYVQYLQMGADVVVGHHPHVPENYELFDDGKMIFYSLGNFIFDTDYQRAHLYTDIGILLRLNFTDEKVDFEALGIKINRTENKIETCPLPDIFENVSADEYQLLAPLGAKAFVAEELRKRIFLNPSKYTDNPEAFELYFSGCSHKEYVKGFHMDFDIIRQLAAEHENMQWQNSKLEKVKDYISTLL